MQTPYEILGILKDANDHDIKQAYLQQVKENTPEKNPAQFQLIHQAYTAIKNQHNRLSTELFTAPTINFDNLLDNALINQSPHTPIDASLLTQLLTLSSEEIKPFVQVNQK